MTTDSDRNRASHRQPRLSASRRRVQTPLLALALVGLCFAGWLIWEKRAIRDDQPRIGLSPPTAFDLSNAAIPRDQILSGGPPKDGIPALADPALIPAEKAEFLQGGDRVIGVFHDGEARAYPLRILVGTRR